jgi:hypothetical protein
MPEPNVATNGAGDAASSRSCEDVINDHLRLREEGKLEEDIRRNYREDVVVLTPSACYRGHEGVRECASLLYDAIRDASEYRYNAVRCDERMALLEWSASSDDMEIGDGVDSFMVEDGEICAQTIRYTVTFRDLSQAHSVG